MGTSTANETMGKFVMFIVVVAISASVVYLWYTNEDFRNGVDYVYDKIKVLFGWDVSDDSQIAIDSTKALACAIDVTAYWSSQDGDALGTRISYIEDPTQAGAPVNPTLFREVGDTDDTQGSWFESCVGDTSGYGVFAPTFSAITTNSGGILGKLSEWSGGGDNKITGHLFETPEDCKIDGIPTCSSEHGPDNTYVCDKDADHIICCEKDLIDKDIYCCDDGYKEMDGTCIKKSTAELEGDADKIVAANPGTAMRFGKTAVVCMIGGGTGAVEAGDFCPFIATPPPACGVDGNVYVCGVADKYIKGTDCAIGCAMKEGSAMCAAQLQCTVKAFELPQRIDGDIVDAAAKWIGVFGEPKYTVYHETFPIGIEGVWKYDSMSAVLTAVFLGGVFNLGGGALKASKTAVVTTSKGLAHVVVKREGLRAALQEGNKAGLERLTLEYGGEMALKKIMVRKFSSSFHGIPQLEIKISNTLTEGMLKKSAGPVDGLDIVTVRGVYENLRPMQQEKFMADMALLIRSGGDDVPADVFEKMIDDIGVEKTLEDVLWDVNSKTLDRNLLFVDVQLMKNSWKKQADPTIPYSEKLLTKDMEDSLKGAVTREVNDAALANGGIRAIVDKSAKDGFKTFRNLRGLLNTPGHNKAFEKQMRAEAGELAEMTYDDIIRKTYNLKKACDNCAGTYIDETYVKTYSALENEAGEGVLEGMNKLKDDADALLNGLTGQKRGEGLISFSHQRKVMVVALAASYLAMVKDANLEKYKSCGSGQVCLHYPKWLIANRGLDEGSTFGFGEGSDLKKEYNNLVSLAGFSNDQTLRMHLISPCKTDLTVTASASACKCETFYSQDIIAYRLDKIACIIDANGNGEYDGEPENVPVDLKADGQCPTTYVLTAPFPRGFNPPLKPGTYKVLTMTYAPSDYTLIDVDEDFGPFKDCSVVAGEALMDTLQKCLDEKLYDESNNLRTPYKQCAEDRFGPCAQFWLPPYVIHQGAPIYTFVSDTINIIPVPLNILPNVDDEKPAETISVCENSWLGDFLDIANPINEYRCITVTPDVTSMKSYSDAGFGINYCATNENTFWQKASKKCFWGSIALSLGIELASVGAATPVILYVVGSGAVACEKIAEIDSKWPKNQFG